MPTIKKFFTGLITGDVNHEEEQDENPSILKKITSGILFTIFLLIGLGNWSDSKALITEFYHGFIANFTHNVEENTLNSLDIGNFLAYAEHQTGMPQVIKKSTINKDIEYRYYKNPKYLLTLISNNNRVAGIIVHSLNHQTKYLSDFAPVIPFTNSQLKINSVKDAIGIENEFFFDNHNIAYFMKSKQLGANGMHLHLSVGYTGYQDEKLNNDLLNKLDHSLVVDDSQELPKIIDNLMNEKSSFYSISELKPEFIADALLTKYEFNAYF